MLRLLALIHWSYLNIVNSYTGEITFLKRNNPPPSLYIGYPKSKHWFHNPLLPRWHFCLYFFLDTMLNISRVDLGLQFYLPYFMAKCQWCVGELTQIDGLVQERRNSIASALELRLSCTNPLKWCLQPDKFYATRQIWRLNQIFLFDSKVFPNLPSCCMAGACRTCCRASGADPCCWAASSCWVAEKKQINANDYFSHKDQTMLIFHRLRWALFNSSA